MQDDLPNGGRGGGTPSPKGASRVGLCGSGGGGGANLGGGAPMQALAPGRWRPSLRHWCGQNLKSLPQYLAVVIPKINLKFYI